MLALVAGSVCSTAANGQKLQVLRLEAAPTWDGIAITHDHYFICLKDGLVVCFSDKLPWSTVR